MDAPPNSQTAGVASKESTQFLDQAVTSTPEGEETKPSSTEWTDEKHSLYLNSMEASFVNQLYDSPDLVGWPPRKLNPSVPRPSPQKHSNTCISSGQFKVLRSGSWQNMKPARGGNLQSNPWIRHYRSSRRCQGAGLLILGENSASINKAVLKQKGKQSVSCGGATTTLHHHDSVASITEVSDQNFVEDEIEGNTKLRMKKAGS